MKTKNILEKFADTKYRTIFASELCNASTSSSVYCDGVFLSAYNKDSIGLLNQSDSRCKTLFGARKVRFSSLFLIFNLNFSLRAMRAPNENASKAKHSTLTSTSPHETGKPSPQSTSVESIDTRRPAAITVRTGIVKKPDITLGEVLNFISHANRRQSRVIHYAMRGTAQISEDGRVTV